MPLNKAGKLRKYHQFIGIFPTKKGTFDHKSTNQPKPSVKTIEKFGGKKIGSTGFYDIYQADLEEDNKKVR